MTATTPLPPPASAPGASPLAIPAPASPVPAARTIDGVKVYGRGDTAVRALDGIRADFAARQFTAIMGASGSGKSTLLHCLAGLDRLTSGETFIAGYELGRLTDHQLTLLRREKVGFIFQSLNLVPTLNAMENIVLPMTIAGRKPDPGVLDAWGDKALTLSPNTGSVEHLVPVPACRWCQCDCDDIRHRSWPVWRRTDRSVRCRLQVGFSDSGRTLLRPPRQSESGPADHSARSRGSRWIGLGGLRPDTLTCPITPALGALSTDRCLPTANCHYGTSVAVSGLRPTGVRAPGRGDPVPGSGRTMAAVGRNGTCL